MKKRWIIAALVAANTFLVMNIGVMAAGRGIRTNGNVKMLDGSNVVILKDDVLYLQSEIDKLFNEITE